MKKLLALSLLTTLQVSADDFSLSSFNKVIENERDTKVKASVGFFAVSQNSDVNKAKKQGLYAGASGHHAFYPNLKLKFNVAFEAESGSTDSLYNNNEFRAKNSFILKEGSLVYDGLKSLTLEAGSLSNDHTAVNQLLISGSILGLRETYTLEGKHFGVRLQALQASPNTNNFSDRVDKVEEGSPSYFQESIQALAKYESFKMKLGLGHFAYDKLSNEVAYSSLFNGNTISGVRETGTNFTYNYQGWSYYADAALTFRDFAFGAYFAQVENTEAPTGANKGTVVGLTGNYYYGSSMHILGAENFEVESDASVAYYNNKYYGHNNKKGARLFYTYKDLANNFEVRTNVVTNKVLEKNDTQANDQILHITLRKFYDLF
ncbi:hypothetical protein HBN50_06490 [Halobacteriovorax sp. GB3]|uniref:hypothetical protein n=1 Tax=Halobacteriovorax sp. GB3 TaxID=2719615 RepID=UPI00236012B8|nr:hypothetical protein [Halobacteriovorax sp. GB3]MDD0852736.1 hypothetical protein [Halobacteriovorax sp. GB3]